MPTFTAWRFDRAAHAVCRWRAGTIEITGPIFRRWQEAPDHLDWYPTSDCVIGRGHCRFQHFFNRRTHELATIASSRRQEAWWLSGPIRDKWLSSSHAAPRVGFPVEDVCPTSDHKGYRQRFQHHGSSSGGVIISHSSTGTFEIHGDIYSRWLAIGAEDGLGIPAGDTRPSGDGRATYSQFVSVGHSRIYSIRSVGVVVIRDPIFSAWHDRGGIFGELGYPLRDEVLNDAGQLEMQFEHGSIHRGARGALHTEMHRRRRR